MVKVSFIFWETATWSVESQPTNFAGNKPARNQHEVGSRIADYMKLINCFAYSLALEMEATYFSETSVNYQRITRSCIPHVTLQVVSLPVAGIVIDPGYG